MKDTAFKLSVCAVLVFVVSIVMASSVLARDTSCKTKYPIILAHGMGFTPTATMPHSFPGIVEALRACGATVYYTTVPALPNAVKSATFKTVRNHQGDRQPENSTSWVIHRAVCIPAMPSNLGLRHAVPVSQPPPLPVMDVHRLGLLTITDVFPPETMMANCISRRSDLCRSK